MSDEAKKPKKCENNSSFVGAGLSLGAGIGVALGAGIGAAFGNVAIGAGVGVALGAGVGMLIAQSKSK
ncbi:MAG: hypothetical protein GXO77_12080 [Calditrichaeota bacterium]|nr:hypothetical protein [Calditrichota bacterium]